MVTRSSHALRCSELVNSVASPYSRMNTSWYTSSASAFERVWLSARRYTASPQSAMARAMKASVRSGCASFSAVIDPPPLPKHTSGRARLFQRFRSLRNLRESLAGTDPPAAPRARVADCVKRGTERGSGNAARPRAGRGLAGASVARRCYGSGYSTPTMTSVDFTMASAAAPSARPRSSMASFVMEPMMRAPSGVSMVT